MATTSSSMKSSHESKGSDYMDKAKDAAGAAVEKTKEVGATGFEKVKEAGATAVEKAKDMGAGMTDKARDVASGLVDKAKETAGDIGKRAEDATHAVGSGMQSLAGTLRENLPREGMLGTATSSVAKGLETSGKYLEKEGLAGIAEDMTNLIRRNPIPALLVGVGLGFLLARATHTHRS